MEHVQWLGVVRHGQSTGNVIAQRAEADGLEEIDIPERDADVPLSDLGREQAATVRDWVAGLAEKPGIAVVSPYLRARQTAEIALAGSGIPVVVDERLRDRELGVLDLLTSRGVDARLPGEAARRRRLGKFYYRPPGGESWTDVLLRLRSALAEPRPSQLWFAHEAIVLLVRYLAEGLDEAGLMEIVRGEAIANCSVSTWRRTGGALRPELFNHVGHVSRPTTQEDVHA